MVGNYYTRCSFFPNYAISEKISKRRGELASLK